MMRVCKIASCSLELTAQLNSLFPTELKKVTSNGFKFRPICGTNVAGNAVAGYFAGITLGEFDELCCEGKTIGARARMASC